MEKQKTDSVGGFSFSLDELHKELFRDEEQVTRANERRLKTNIVHVNTHVVRHVWQRFKVLIKLGWIPGIRQGVEEALIMYMQEVEKEEKEKIEAREKVLAEMESGKDESSEIVEESEEGADF